MTVPALFMWRVTMCVGLSTLVFLGLVVSTLAISAQTTIEVQINTGGDDLRGGNTAYLSIIRTDGSVTRPQVLSRGAAGHSVQNVTVTFPETVDLGRIAGLEIRHDGNPRSGHPFDTVDQWIVSRLQFWLRGGAQAFEPDTDRFGGDFRHLALPAGSNAETCARECYGDLNCHSWTFARGADGYLGCWLKNVVPQPTRRLGLTSGVVERNIDRPGGDTDEYRSSVHDCHLVCKRATELCRSWTFVPRTPGAVVGTCFLKGSVPAPRSAAGMISGISRHPLNTLLYDTQHLRRGRTFRNQAISFMVSDMLRPAVLEPVPSRPPTPPPPPPHRPPPPDPTPLPEVRHICRSAPMPPGWIKINDYWSSTTCGSPTSSTDYNVWVIQRYENIPVGLSLIACSGMVPRDWTFLGYSWDPTRCGHPTAITNNMMSMRRRE